MNYSSFSIQPNVISAMWIRRTLSVLLGILFLFELLNYFHVFSYKVDYTWFGRFFSTFFMLGALRVLDEGFRKKLGTRLHGTVWILMTGLLWFDFLGDLFHFYSRCMWYDQVAHFMSGIALVVSLLLVIKTCAVQLEWKVPTAVIVLLAMGINTIFAVLYELEEYLEDYLFHTNRLGDAFDTTNDLLMNLLAGAVTIAGFFVWKRLCRPTPQRL